MKGSFFVFAIFLFACTSPQGDRIIVPELHAGFYSEALNEIDDKLQSDPDNDRLINQKIYYCEQLDWPVDCISALNAHRKKFGMSNQLVRQYIDYYQKHDLSAPLLDLFDRWEDEYKLKVEYPKTYIDCLVKTNNRKRSLSELRAFLMDNQNAEDLAFASSSYLSLADTTLAVFNMSKLHKLQPENALNWDYGVLLITIGRPDKGVEVLNRYVNKNELSLNEKLIYADLLDGIGMRRSSRKVLKPHLEMDTAAYLMASSYQKDFIWDSAAYILESVLARDSSNRKALWKTGRLYEERGWLLYAMRYFEQLETMYPDDTIATQRIDLIQRKIAYLQRQKFEESKAPILELKPKKLDN